MWWNAGLEILVMLGVLIPASFLVSRMNEKRYRRLLAAGGKNQSLSKSFDAEDSEEDDEEGDSDRESRISRRAREEEEDDDLYDSEPESEDDHWDEGLLEDAVDDEIENDFNEGDFPSAGRGGGSYTSAKPQKGMRVIIKGGKRK